MDMQQLAEEWNDKVMVIKNHLRLKEILWFLFIFLFKNIRKFNKSINNDDEKE